MERAVEAQFEIIDREIEEGRFLNGLAHSSLQGAKLENELSKSEEPFFKLFHASSHPMAITTVKEGYIVDFNEALVCLIGYKREELIGKSTMEYGVWADEQQRERVLQKLRAEGIVHNLEVGLRTKAGSIQTVLFSISKIILGGEPYLFNMAVNITDQKNAEKELKESGEKYRKLAEALQQAEQKYRSIFENALEGIFRTSPDGKFLAANPSLARMLGYVSPDEFIAAITDIRRQLFADPGRCGEFLYELKNQGGVRGFEFQALCRDGNKIWLSIYIRASRNSSGKILYYDGYVEDITEHKQDDENLRRALDWQKAIFEGSRDAVIISDRNLNFIDANERACELLGYSKEELLKLGAWDLNKKTDPSVLDGLRRRILSGEDLLGETEAYTKDGRKIDAEFGHRCVSVGNEVYIHSIIRDIANQKRLEAQLLQSQKIEAIGVLAGGVAHDFNNLLTVIKGYTELLLKNSHPDETNHKDLEQIDVAAKRAEGLTSQLLAFSRKQVIQPVILNLSDVLYETNKMLQRLIGEDIEIACITKSDLGLVNADRGQIQQIIMNLAVNARDAMPDGGRLTIETANIDFDKKYVRTHPPAKAGQYVMLAMSDTGIGMNATTQARIFEPFFTTKAKGKGTGLGLSMVYGIVKQSNGFIWVYSEPGKGTTFKIYLPRVEGEITPITTEKTLEQEFRGSETILLAEDEVAVRALAGRILRDRGYNVIEAADGMEALRLAQEYEGEIHLILTDVVMPGMSGKELVSKIEAVRPGIKALYISGYTDDAIVRHGVLDPEVAFLQKPFTIDGFSRKVREVINS